MLQSVYDLVQSHGDHAQDQNGCDQDVQLEETISMKDMDIHLTGERNQKKFTCPFQYNTEPPDTQAEVR